MSNSPVDGSAVGTPIPSAPALPQQTDQVAQLQAQVTALTSAVNTMMQAMTAGRVRGATFEQIQASAASPPVSYPPPPTALSPQQPGAYGFDEEHYYVRIKPYNPKRGYFRRRQYFDEIGRAIDGGTGEPGDIPQWFFVTRDQAIKLARYKQKPNDPRSEPVLDIVTAAEKAELDHVESQYRAATLGLLGVTPAQQLAMAKQAGSVQAQVANQVTRDNRPVTRSRPDAIIAAQSYQEAMRQVPQPMMQAATMQGTPPSPYTPLATTQPQQPLPAQMAGRAAALQNLPPPPPATAAPLPEVVGAAEDYTAPLEPQTTRHLPTERGVDEDLTRSAASDVELAAAIEAAAMAEGRGRTAPGRR